jgi:hypothetical protein
MPLLSQAVFDTEIIAAPNPGESLVLGQLPAPATQGRTIALRL